jgi:uncharacterized peroxidase-related enzyme
MSWIKKIAYGESTGELREIYDRIAGKDGYIDNILTIHGQRPHTLVGHMTLYKNVLHHKGNTLSKWVLELVGVYTSILNGCAYCVAHHFEGLRALVNDDERARRIRAALESGDLDSAFGPREAALLRYTEKLTQRPGEMEQADVTALREQGLSEGEVLEINQVVSYFAYVNRTALGLGVDTDGDMLGLSPSESDDPDSWTHQEAQE